MLNYLKNPAQPEVHSLKRPIGVQVEKVSRSPGKNLRIRVSEAVGLKKESPDKEWRLIRLRRGNERKNRHPLLSEGAPSTAQAYFKVNEPEGCLFPGMSAERRPNARIEQKVRESARKKPEIPQRTTVHTPRHNFTSHLPETGTDLEVHSGTTGTQQFQDLPNLYLCEQERA